MVHHEDVHEKTRNKPNWHQIGISALVGILFLWIVGALNQVKRPGSFFEKASYSGKFYVLVYPEINTVKNYKIPGDIEKELEDCAPEDSCNSIYYLNNIYWPNGGTTSFSDCSISDKKSFCTSDDDNDYYIELTSESAD
jgi:hypothetical protein